MLWISSGKGKVIGGEARVKKLNSEGVIFRANDLARQGTVARADEGRF